MDTAPISAIILEGELVMKIIIASDIHVSTYHLETLLNEAVTIRAETVVMNGDLVPMSLLRGMTAVEAIAAHRTYLKDIFLPMISRCRQRIPELQIYADFGNEDFWCNRDVLIEAETTGLIHLLHNKVQPLTDNLDIAGYMFVPLTPFMIKDAERIDNPDIPLAFDVRMEGVFTVPNGPEKRQVDRTETIENDLKALRQKITRQFVLATHAPPYGLGLDVLHDGRPVGSMAIRAFIEQEADSGRLVAAFAGHIHDAFENSGVLASNVNGRPVVNAGQRHELLKYALFDTETRDVIIKTARLRDA